MVLGEQRDAETGVTGILDANLEKKKPCFALGRSNAEQGNELTKITNKGFDYGLVAGVGVAGAAAALKSLGVERYPLAWFLPTSKTTIS